MMGQLVDPEAQAALELKVFRAEPNWKLIAKDLYLRLRKAEYAIGDPEHPRWSRHTADPVRPGYRSQHDRAWEIIRLLDPYRPELDAIPLEMLEDEAEWDRIYLSDPVAAGEDYFEREANERVLQELKHGSHDYPEIGAWLEAHDAEIIAACGSSVPKEES